jgi:hypothetical protein
VAVGINIEFIKKENGNIKDEILNYLEKKVDFSQKWDRKEFSMKRWK